MEAYRGTHLELFGTATMDSTADGYLLLAGHFAVDGPSGDWTTRVDQAAVYSDGLWGGFFGRGAPDTTGFV